jgi:hypothetical protein
MPNPPEVSLAQYTWAAWKREALTARARARRTAWLAFGVVTAAVILAGWSNVDGTWRYSVIVYAPVVALIVFGPVERLSVRSSFRTTGAAMRYRLVPRLVAHATDEQLAELAASNSVSIDGRLLEAVDTGKEVIVSVGRARGSFGGEAGVFEDVGGADWGEGGGFGGDGGGGFGGGGGGGDGGGG